MKRHIHLVMTVSCIIAMSVFSGTEEHKNTTNEKRLLPPADTEASLVLIESRMDGKRRKSHGITVKMDEQTYILTSQRSLLGCDQIRFTTLTGKNLNPVRIELSAHSDLARLLLKDDMVSRPFSSGIHMNMPITLLTTDENNETMFSHGTVIGVGGTKIEITTEFDDMAGGSPIIDSEGIILGIASFSREASKRYTNIGTRFEETPRYFGCRIPSHGWKAVNWRSYNNKFGKVYCRNTEVYDEVISILKESDSYNAAKKEASDIAKNCRNYALKTRKLTEQKDISGFLLNEFENQAAVLEYAEEWFSKYAEQR